MNTKWHHPRFSRAPQRRSQRCIIGRCRGTAFRRAVAGIRTRVVGVLITSFAVAAVAFGQTNSDLSVRSLQLFSAPAIQLRPAASGPGSTIPLFAKNTAGGLSLTENMHASNDSLSGSASTLQSTAERKAEALDMNRWLIRNGYLTPRRAQSDNRLVRAMDAVFKPEVIHVRKMTVACSVVTAIKRKNPLCLLNPVFLNVSW